jgi:hypothetical protein
MSRSQMIAIREPGKKLGPDFIAKALEEFPTALGYASPQGEEVHVDCWKADTVDLADALGKIETTYAADRVFYVFMKSDEEIDEESLQPNKIIVEGEGDDEKVHVACITDGDFVDFASEGEPSETNDLRMIRDHLMPKIEELAAVVDGDIDMLVPLLYKPAFKEHVSKALAPRGSITLIPAAKDKLAVGFSEGIEPGSWSWGWSSRTLGLQKKEEPAPAEKKGGLVLKKKAPTAAAEGKPYPLETAGEPPAEKKEAADDPKKKFEKLLRDAEGRFYLKDNVLWTKPWHKGAKYREMRQAFIKHFGVAHVPANSESPDPETGKIIAAGRPFEELKEDSNIRIWAQQQLNEKTPKEADSVQAPVNPNADKERLKKPDEGMTLRVTKEQKERYTTQLVKANLIKKVDGTKLSEYVAKYPRFSIEMGENFDDVLMWSPETIRRVGDIGTHALVCLCHEYRCHALNLYDQKQEKKTEPEHITAPEPVAAPAPKGKLVLKKKVA